MTDRGTGSHGRDGERLAGRFLVEALARLRARMGAFRWIILRVDAGRWRNYTPFPEVRDSLYEVLAPRLPMTQGVRILETKTLGDLGVRLSDDAVKRIGVVRTSEDAAIVFESPALDVPDLDVSGFDLSAGSIADLRMRNRRAEDLSSLAGWVDAAKLLNDPEMDEPRALQDLAEELDLRSLTCLRPHAGGCALHRLERLPDGGWEQTSQIHPGAVWPLAAGPLGVDAARIQGEDVAWSADGGCVLIARSEKGPVSGEALALAATLFRSALAVSSVAETSRSHAVAEERARMASLIHEGVTQAVANVALQLQVLDLTLDDPGKARDALQRSREAVQGALEELRAQILELSPRIPEWTDLQQGLERAVADFAAEWGIQAECDCDDPVSVDRDGTAIAFSFVQEALTNVRKHAPRARVTVRCRKTDRGLKIDVSDDGPGFDPAVALVEGWMSRGLGLLRSRLILIGGDIEIRSSPGAGTAVTATIPSRRTIQ